MQRSERRVRFIFQGTHRWVLGLLVTLGAPALAGSGDTETPATDTALRFVDVWDPSGLEFLHFGQRSRWCALPTEQSQVRPVVGVATNEKIEPLQFLDPIGFARRHLIRMNGSGVAWLDYDNDLDWDLYFVNGKDGEETKNALYRNNGHGTFSDVTVEAKVGDTGEGMAVAAADYDNDGYTDLLVTNFGGVVLYRNLGNGSFADVTHAALGSAARQGKHFWYGGATWGDYDRDGFLDLYLAGYVDIDHPPEGRNLRFPMSFPGLPNFLLRNRGDSTFEDRTQEAFGNDLYRNKSMQVLFADFNEDGWPDLFVGNDTDPNSLFLNRRDGTFQEDSGPSGVSSTDGTMGIGYGDYDGDGLSDLVLTNFAGEAAILYQLVSNQSSNDGKIKNAIYTSDFRSPELLFRTWPLVGWGTALADLDNDSDLDLFIAHGHLNSVDGNNRQANALFENDGQGRLVDVSDAAGVLATGPRIHRGVALADVNADGRLDLVVTNNGEQSPGDPDSRPEDGKGLLLLNRSSTPDHHWLQLRLVGTRSNRDAIGARVVVRAGRRVLHRELVSGLSYFSSHAPEVHVGLGTLTRVDEVEVVWPRGLRQSFSIPQVDRAWRLTEGGGAEALPLPRTAGGS